VRRPAALSADRSWPCCCLPHFGWRVIFVLGGVFPLVLVPVLALWLPESPRFLATKQNLSPRHAAVLQRLDLAPGESGSHPVDVAPGNPVKMLFGRGYALQTVLLWIMFFCSLMNLFLFAYWMPTVFNLLGMTPAQAVFASSLRDFGAIWAVLYLGSAIDRVGPERSLAVHYAAGAGRRRARRSAGHPTSEPARDRAPAA
jgi:MFS transporter, AAHS family, 4-hydroxybenzoate transporter